MASVERNSWWRKGGGHFLQQVWCGGKVAWDLDMRPVIRRGARKSPTHRVVVGVWAAAHCKGAVWIMKSWVLSAFISFTAWLLLVFLWNSVMVMCLLHWRNLDHINVIGEGPTSYISWLLNHTHFTYQLRDFRALTLPLWVSGVKAKFPTFQAPGTL